MNGTLLSQTGKITRAELAAIATPPGTPTHRPIPHSEIVAALIETLAFRHIAVARDEYAVSADGMKMFGVLDLEAGMVGVNFSIGIRNAHDKSMRLAMTVGYRVIVCDNMAFVGDFMPVLHKHSKNLDLIELVSIGVDKIQRNFEPLKRQIGDWQTRILEDDRVKLILYAAFVEGRIVATRDGGAGRSGYGVGSGGERAQGSSPRRLEDRRAVQDAPQTARFAQGVVYRVRACKADSVNKIFARTGECGKYLFVPFGAWRCRDP